MMSPCSEPLSSASCCNCCMDADIAVELVSTDIELGSMTGTHLQIAIWSASSREGISSPETSRTFSLSATCTRMAPGPTSSQGWSVRDDRTSRTDFEDGSACGTAWPACGCVFLSALRPWGSCAFLPAFTTAGLTTLMKLLSNDVAISGI